MAEGLRKRRSAPPYRP